jgi:hypothetical protein
VCQWGHRGYRRRDRHPAHPNAAAESGGGRSTFIANVRTFFLAKKKKKKKTFIANRFDGGGEMGVAM